MNPSTSSARRVVVIGGGIFGVSSALHLQRLGVATTIVTEGTPSSGASGRSLSWLNSARRRSMPYHALRMAGIDRYRTLAHHHPEAAWLRFDGALTWDADDATNEIAAIHAHERGIGYDTRHLRPSEVAAVTPGVDASAITRQGAIFNAGEGWVDLPSLVRVLLGAFRGLGGTLIENAGRARVEVVGGRASGVVTGEGTRFEADAVLLAVGPATPAMLAESGIAMPDATPVSMLLKTKPAALKLRAVLNTPRVAIRPTPDGALVLDSAWSEGEVGPLEDGGYAIRDSTLEGLLREASRVLDGNPVLELASYGVGPKPIPADGDPVFGELGEIAHYHVAFSHSGATLGLIAGEMLAGEIATGTPHPMLANFRPGRFARARVSSNA